MPNIHNKQVNLNASFRKMVSEKTYIKPRMLFFVRIGTTEATVLAKINNQVRQVEIIDNRTARVMDLNKYFMLWELDCFYNDTEGTFYYKF